MEYLNNIRMLLIYNIINVFKQNCLNEIIPLLRLSLEEKLLEKRKWITQIAFKIV